MVKPRRLRYSLDLFRTFDAAARHLNLTHAARELFLTPSAVSRSIKTLEQQLGHSVFRRVDRGLVLTEGGQALHDAVSGALESIDKAMGSMAGSRARPALTVTTNIATASLWLVPRLPAFAQQHARIDLRVLATDRLVNLEREQVDVAIRHFPPEARRPELEPLVTERVFPVCAPRLLKGRRRMTDLRQVARHVLLQFETYTSLGPWLDWDRWMETSGLTGAAPAGIMRFTQYDHVIELALRGTGIALGRHPLIAEHLRTGRLVAPFGTQGVVSGALYAVLGPRARETAAVKAFIDWLKAEAKRDSAS